MASQAPAPDPAWAAWVQSSLQSIRDARLERALRPLVPTASPVQALMDERELGAWLAGAPPPGAPPGPPLGTRGPGAAAAAAAAAGPLLKPLVLFSLNDYLGLSGHPAVRAAAAQAALQVGCGPRSSALVGGFTSEHRRLELELAALKGTQDALLFPTGYAANVAVVSVLAGAAAAAADGQRQAEQQQQQQQPPRVVVFSDELNHASIIDGARLAARGTGGGGGGMALRVYRHNDLAHLEQLLAAAPAGALKLVVTDSLFSMDGDFADLWGLARLKATWGFLLVVDEAHATLVCGDQGGGAAELAGVSAAVDVHVGTLSKAAGALGGFAACSSELRALLLNRGRSLIYSTALPVPVVAAARAALGVSRREHWRRRHVWSLTRLLARRLGVAAASPIVPLVVGGEQAALELSQRLLAAGFHVPAIRPPTVPPGTCRLRVSLSADHSVAQVEALAAAVRAGLSDLGLCLTNLPHLLEPAQQLALRHHLHAHLLQEEQPEGAEAGSGRSVGSSRVHPARARM